MTTGGFPDATIKQMRLDLLNRHNNYRRQRGGRIMLEIHGALQRGAQDHADWMARTGIYGHSKDVNKASWNTFGDLLDSHYWGGGENVASGISTVAAVMATSGRTWRTSCGHYYNMVNGGWAHVGFGISKSRYGTFWCTRFGGNANGICGTRCPAGCGDHNFYSNDPWKLPYG
jgi:uncharacterized protein YkwD